MIVTKYALYNHTSMLKTLKLDACILETVREGLHETCTYSSTKRISQAKAHDVGSCEPPDPEFLVNNLFSPDLSAYSCSEHKTLRSS